MNILKRTLLPALALAAALHAPANTEPTVIINSAAMRDGTTLMDVSYRVNDPDDTTVKTRALAFVDGTRSFANVIRPETFTEGTDSNLGDTITTNTDHTLTWDVGADWDIDLGQVKFEVLAQDKGLLEFDWITIPAAGGEPELTISQNSPTDSDILDAFFWLYASQDSGLDLSNGILTGNINSGVFNELVLVDSQDIDGYASAYLFKHLDLAAAKNTGRAITARANLQQADGWHVENQPWDGITIVHGWGANNSGGASPEGGLSNVTSLAAGAYYSMALKSDGTVVAWGNNSQGQSDPPANLTDATYISAGYRHALAVKSNGTIVGWGYNLHGQTDVPPSLKNCIAAEAADNHSIALKDDGTVVGWGYNFLGQIDVPAGLTNVTSISAAGSHNLALHNDGTVTAWGYNNYGQTNVPAGLANVMSISAGSTHSLALKSDGTVVAWGRNNYGQTNVPSGLTDVVAIAAGTAHNLALKSDGTVIGWGADTADNRTLPPVHLNNAIAIAAGNFHSLAVEATEL